MLSVFENRMLKIVTGTTRRKCLEVGEDCKEGSSIICTRHQILLGHQTKEDETSGHAARIGFLGNDYKTC
jgi:hypothetical protein